MGEVGGGLEMPVSAALDQFDAAARMALCDRHDDHAHRPGRNLVAEPRRNLPRVERFVAGEQHRLDRAFQIVDGAHAQEYLEDFRTKWARLPLESQQGPWEKFGPITAATSSRRLRSSRVPHAHSLDTLRQKTRGATPHP